MRARVGDRGFTLTELMVVLVIVGILAGLAIPYLGRDRKAAFGREFASTVAHELRRARMLSVAARLPIRAYIFGDRIELRSAVAGARPGEAPRAPTLADPVLSVVPAQTGVTVLDVAAVATPPAAAALDTATFRQVEFNPRGQAQLVGQPPLTPAVIYIRNSQVSRQHRESDFRIDVAAVTGLVRLRTGWN